MSRYEDIEGELPSDQQLAQLGVVRCILARELGYGLQTRVFRDALSCGLNIASLTENRFIGTGQQ